MTDHDLSSDEAASIVAEKYGVSDAHLRMVFNGMGEKLAVKHMRSVKQDKFPGEGKQPVATYPTAIASQLQLFSRKLSEMELLTNIFWVLIDHTGEKTIYKFRRNNELLIIRAGTVERASWTYIERDFILLEIPGNRRAYLLKNAFFDPDFLLLSINCSKEVAFFVNEQLFAKTVNTQSKVEALLVEKYIRPQKKLSQDKKRRQAAAAQANTPRYSAFRKKTGKAKAAVVKFEIVFSRGMSGEIFINRKRKNAYFRIPIKRFLFTFNKKRTYKNRTDCIKGLYNYLAARRPKEKPPGQQSADREENGMEEERSFLADEL